ncbi:MULTISPECIES: glycosyltransferase 87 family protein [Actinosynnema]|uniref:glycosyltransferase 87 family protein n=1 Tax=Actinosynnema TaxID=40566 RepID=UPI0020A5375F|nr:glycosyltransferase 87 family protein [Actinosynnema pretiosum]MCP2092390.1 alpha-1,2-mannosyltransferase [Actinosynnema pretiosum]
MLPTQSRSTLPEDRRRALGLPHLLWAVVALSLVVHEWSRSGFALIDLRVYRVGGEAWLSGVPLYAPGFPAPLQGPELPFTYPPLAAVLFALVEPLPWTVAAVAWTVLCVLALTAVCVLAARRLNAPPQLGVLVATGALLLEPVRATLDFGQVNLFLMALVAFDCLVERPVWRRGVLTGIAAAVKLTPLVFLIFFLARGDRRSAAWAAGTFAGGDALGFLLAPSDSAGYWFGALLDPGRIGGIAYASNVSVRGALHRLGLPGGVEPVLWLLLAAGVAAVAWLAARRHEPVTALVAVSAVGLLASPISWSHHWVWAAPALVVAAHAAWSPSARPVVSRSTARWVVVGLGAVFLAGAQWRLPNGGDRELGWAWWQHLVGSGYAWCAVAALAWLAFSGRARLA